MEAINFEDIAELTVARQDELAAKWAKHIADSVQQAAEAGQDCVYLSQVTDKGYVPNMKRLFIEHLRIGNVSKAFVAVKDDFDAVCQLIGIETLDQQRGRDHRGRSRSVRMSIGDPARGYPMGQESVLHTRRGSAAVLMERLGCAKLRILRRD